MSLYEANLVNCCTPTGTSESCILYQTSATCGGRRSAAAALSLCTSFDYSLLTIKTTDFYIGQYCILTARYYNCLRNVTSQCMHNETETKLSEMESLMDACCGSDLTDCPGRLPCLNQSVSTCPENYNETTLLSTTEATRVQRCDNTRLYVACAKNFTTNCPLAGSYFWGISDTWYRSCCLSSGPTISCPIPVTSCAPINPCLNGGNCTNPAGGGYTCTCPKGFNGSRCENNTNECASSPCPKNAACDDQIDAYRCICPAGFEGSFCNITSACPSNSNNISAIPDPALCDYYFQCSAPGAKPIQQKCGLFNNKVSLLFDTLSHTCKLPSYFSAGTAKTSTNCTRPSV